MLPTSSELFGTDHTYIDSILYSEKHSHTWWDIPTFSQTNSKYKLQILHWKNMINLLKFRIRDPENLHTESFTCNDFVIPKIISTKKNAIKSHLHHSWSQNSQTYVSLEQNNWNIKSCSFTCNDFVIPKIVNLHH